MSATLELTDECHHYVSKGEVPWDIQKYWQQRHSIFSRYDEGIYMTDDGWFGVTPEPFANKLSKDIALAYPDKTTIIDIFGGSGGNSIAFALNPHYETVIAIEKDAATLACAQANATLYGVNERITWIHDDCFHYLAQNSPDAANTVIFASPPWGGVGYRSDEVFDVESMPPYGLKDLVRVGRAGSDGVGMEVVMFLPRTSDLRQIARYAPEGKKIEAVQYCMEGASKALVIFMPASVSSEKL